jgi:hypothetical protein
LGYWLKNKGIPSSPSRLPASLYGASVFVKTTPDKTQGKKMSGAGRHKRGTSYIAEVKHIFFLFNINRI